MIFIIGIFFMIVSWLVSNKLKNKFKEYSQIRLYSNMSGKEIAEKMLIDHGIYDVKVICVEGELTDHYNPLDKTVNLSLDVYESRSVAAAAVASHECGHAVQHATAYSFLQIRSMMVPIQNVSARILNIIFFVTLFGGIALTGMSSLPTILLIVIGCHFIVTLVSLITLPVEFDASSRALAWINQKGIVTTQEHEIAKDALKWAAMTYVVAAIASLTTLIYYILQYIGMKDE
ncbi:MAG: zinc metallopeptidase [Chitinophagaceae bacterium]|nr:zinc metallopeptidase [Chitinophagaceae bacterium]